MSVHLVIRYVIESETPGPDEKPTVIPKLTKEQELMLCKQLRYQKEPSDFAKRKGWKSKEPPIIFYIDAADQYITSRKDTMPGKIIKICFVRVPLYVGVTFSPKPDAVIYPNIYSSIEYKFKADLMEHQIPMVIQAYKQLLTYRTTTLGVYTGAGKTVMAAWLAVHLKRSVVVIVHRNTLPKQWMDTFKTFTDCKVTVYGEKNYDPNANVFICMNTRAVELSKNFNPGLMIIDEAECLCTPSNKEPLLCFNPQYIIACTATPKRPDGMEKMIHAMCGTHGIFESSTKKFKVIKIETGVTIPDEYQTYHEMKEYINNYLPIHQLIFNLVTMNVPHKFLILTRSVKLTKTLSEMFTQRGIRSDWMASTKKNYSDSQVLIGTMEKIGTGFDEKTFCDNFNGQRMDYLILAGSIKSLQKTEQSVGRVLRATHPVVFDLVHNHRILKSHFSERRKWYKSRNADISVHKLAQETVQQEVYKVNSIEMNAVDIEQVESGGNGANFHPDWLD